jgi:RND family efflux transporter MFP subunit
MSRTAARADSAPVTRRTPAAARTVAAVSLLALVAGGCRSSQAEAPPPADAPVPVTAVIVGEGRADDVVLATGTIAGREEVPLAFTIGGIVARIEPRPGDAVRAGQRLAALEPTEIAAQVSSSDEAVAKAARDVARLEQLHRDSVATLEQLQDARTALAVARNARRAAGFNASHAVITAPGDGVVLARTAEPGQLVAAGRPVLVLRRAGGGMVVRAALPDRDALRVHVGDAATVTLEALPDARLTGRVVRRGAAADAASGSYEIEIALGADAAALPSGLVARVAIAPTRTGATAAARPMVPIEALVDADGDSATVFVVRADGRTVERRPVKFADVAESLQGARLPVVAGLAAGERVVTGNATRLADGTRVAVAAPTDGANDVPAWRTTP